MKPPVSLADGEDLARRYLARIRRSHHPDAAASPIGALGQAAVDLLQGRELAAPALPPLDGDLVLEPGWEAELDQVPAHLRAGLFLYLTRGIETGGFLRAVLENDLQKAVARCSSPSLLGLREVASFLFNFAPAGCWGSPAAVQRWLDDHVRRRAAGEPPVIVNPKEAL